MFKLHMDWIQIIFPMGGGSRPIFWSLNDNPPPPPPAADEPSEYIFYILFFTIMTVKAVKILIIQIAEGQYYIFLKKIRTIKSSKTYM